MIWLSDPELEMERKILKEMICVSLTTLTPREAFVLNRRYGLFGLGEWTYEEIGKMLGLSRAYVKNISDKAIRKLQHPIRSRFFEGFMLELLRKSYCTREEQDEWELHCRHLYLNTKRIVIEMFRRGYDIYKDGFFRLRYE